jgi:uncharacterized protein YbjT (DUF2867 family)
MAEAGRLVLVTGASGYIGGRLAPLLVARGYKVRCLARHPEYVRPRVGTDVEVVAGDVLDPATLPAALAGVGTAYYMIHSMGSKRSFVTQDREGAVHFADAARAAGVGRIIYLGGLGTGSRLSPHLASRHEVGQLLGQSGVPTVELRASVIIGSGSLSFELVRALVEKLPVMLIPRWVNTMAQPIAVEDVLDYLVEAATVALPSSAVFEIGGADRMTYANLLREYARQRGLRRLMIPVPVLTPWLSSLWLGLVTPLQARVGRKLIDSLVHETVVMDDSAARTFAVRPRSVRQAIERALVNEDRQFAQTRWSDALSSAPATRFGGIRFGGRLLDSRTIETDRPPEVAFAPIERIGGRTGYYHANWLWQIRGMLDRLVGGVGLRRGRRHPHELRPGDAVDFWRVEAIERPRLLRLVAEMRLPGRAWLQFEVEPTPRGSLIRQTALFDPIGLTGLAYWYGIWPLHQYVFGRMLASIARA